MRASSLIWVFVWASGCHATFGMLPPGAWGDARSIEEVPALSAYDVDDLSRLGIGEANWADARARLTVVRGEAPIAEVYCRGRRRPRQDWLLACRITPSSGGPVSYLEWSFPERSHGTFQWRGRAYTFAVEHIRTQDVQTWTLCAPNEGGPLVTTLWGAWPYAASFVFGTIGEEDGEAAAVFARIVESQVDLAKISGSAHDLPPYAWPTCGASTRLATVTSTVPFTLPTTTAVSTSTSPTATIVTGVASSTTSPALSWMRDGPTFAMDVEQSIVGPQTDPRRQDFFFLWNMAFGLSGVGVVALIDLPTPAYGAPPAHMDLGIGLDFRDLVSLSAEVRLGGAELGDGALSLPGQRPATFESSFAAMYGGALRLTLVRAFGLELYGGATLGWSLRQGRYQSDDFRAQSCRTSDDCTPPEGLRAVVSYSGPSAGPLAGLRMGLERSTGQGLDLVLESRATFTRWRAPSLENDGGEDARLPSAQTAWSNAWRADAHASQLSVVLGFQARF